MTIDNNNIEVVRAINRNTDELRRITTELKRLGVAAKDTGEALSTVLRLTEPAPSDDPRDRGWVERVQVLSDGTKILHSSKIVRLSEPAVDATRTFADDEEDG